MDPVSSLLSSVAASFDMGINGRMTINNISNTSDSDELLVGRDAVVKKLENSSWADLSNEEQLLYLYG